MNNTTLLIFGLIASFTASPAAPTAPEAAAPAVTQLEMASMAGSTLQVTCPETFKDFCGAAYDPSVAGTATASGGCAPYTITYADSEQVTCPADRFQHDILRTWTVTDSCGNSGSCVQELHIVRQIWFLDIKPTSCPNPINIGGGGGQVSVGILGTATQDVSQIDPNSVRIWREKCAAGPLAPNMVSFEDVGTPFVGNACGCHTLGADGFMDLRLRFDKQDLIQVLNLANVPNMTYTRLVVTARLYSGCEIIASDCVRVQ
jgi:hypothetical protein